LGLPSIAKLSHIAFLSSLAAAAPYLVRAGVRADPTSSWQQGLEHSARAAHGIVQVEPLVEPAPAAACVPQEPGRPTLRDSIPAYGAGAPQVLQFYDERRQAANRLQHRLATAMLKQAAQAAVDAMDEQQRAAHSSSTGPHASAWLSCLPSEPGLCLDDASLSIAVRRLLNLPLAHPCIACKCADHIAKRLHHTLGCCTRGDLLIARHDLVATAIARALQRAGLSVCREPELAYHGSQLRPDIEAFAAGDRFYLDVGITLPNVNEQKSLQAARRCENNKRRKYGNARPVGPAAHFVPFIVEAHGAFGNAATEFISQVADLIESEKGEIEPELSGDELRQLLISTAAVQVQRGNAVMVLKARERSERLLHLQRSQCHAVVPHSPSDDSESGDDAASA